MGKGPETITDEFTIAQIVKQASSSVRSDTKHNDTKNNENLISADDPYKSGLE